MKSNSNKTAVASDDAIRTSYTALQFEKEMPREAMSRSTASFTANSIGLWLRSDRWKPCLG